MKRKVLDRYPSATMETNKSPGCFCIWDIPLPMAGSYDDRNVRTRCLLGLGKDETEAWANAYFTIQRQEGWGAQHANGLYNTDES
jgi:hypothetical protein